MSLRNKMTDICDHIMQATVDLMFQYQTRLRPEGDESDCPALTLPGFCFRSRSSKVWCRFCYIETICFHWVQILLYRNNLFSLGADSVISKQSVFTGCRFCYIETICFHWVQILLYRNNLFSLLLIVVNCVFPLTAIL